MAVPRTDLLLMVFAAPHRNEHVMSALRLATAVLERGASLQIWTCGDATGLTWAGHGDSKPRNITDWERDYPSTAALAAGLLADHPGRLHWYVCRACSDDRGVADQIPQVRRKSPFRFVDHVRAADKTLSLGVC
ncbi:hypothetical protein IHE55_09715 [Streptomyces pactum]|uniref:DsrE family protein n=1 Tax=Streptomyces pactum TaxID=68249 RepID=A0ABS0NIS4_9ACTN|nr:hypothetical protein [Streptomyces pactum]MBH5335056.1 hypothetical protein [Streptomyces pactum]